MFAAALSYAGYEAARRGVNYVGDVIGGAYGLGLMRNTVTNFTTTGQNLAGPLGGAVGNVVGKAAAGLAVNEAAKQAQAVSTAINTLGTIGVDLAQNHTSKTKVDNNVTPLKDAVASEKTEGKKTDWANIALQTAKAGLVLGTAAALMGTGAGVLVVPLVTSIPGVINAVMDSTTKAADVDFVGDVVAPVTTQVAIGALGTLADGITRYNIVEGAYDSRIALGERIGAGIDYYMPNAVKGFFGTVGKTVGTIDANRVAMAPKTIERAVQVGANTKQAVEAGLHLTNAVVQNQIAKSNNEEGANWADTARKAAWIGGGIVAGGALTVLAPAAAPSIIGAAAISAAPQAARYIKAKYFGTESGEANAADKNADVEVDLDDFVILEKDNLEQTETIAVDSELTKSKIASSLDLSALMSSVSQEPESDVLSKSWVLLPRAAEAA